MRYREITTEAAAHRYRLFHGSDHAGIIAFRLDRLRHRTGTPGTLSFTTSAATARIYGPHIYTVDVRGTFGDYRNPADVEQNFAWRWPKREQQLSAAYPQHQQWIAQFRKPPESREHWLTRVAADERRDIAAGHYAMWENIGLWRAMGWDGAWCAESGSRNLIVGNVACLRMVTDTPPSLPD